MRLSEAGRRAEALRTGLDQGDPKAAARLRHGLRPTATRTTRWVACTALRRGALPNELEPLLVSLRRIARETTDGALATLAAEVLCRVGADERAGAEALADSVPAMRVFLESATWDQAQTVLAAMGALGARALPFAPLVRPLTEDADPRTLRLQAPALRALAAMGPEGAGEALGPHLLHLATEAGDDNVNCAATDLLAVLPLGGRPETWARLAPYLDAGWITEERTASLLALGARVESGDPARWDRYGAALEGGSDLVARAAGTALLEALMVERERVTVCSLLDRHRLMGRAHLMRFAALFAPSHYGPLALGAPQCWSALLEASTVLINAPFITGAALHGPAASLVLLVERLATMPNRSELLASLLESALSRPASDWPSGLMAGLLDHRDPAVRTRAILLTARVGPASVDARDRTRDTPAR